jgi:hypothetical protein
MFQNPGAGLGLAIPGKHGIFVVVVPFLHGPLMISEQLGHRGAWKKWSFSPPRIHDIHRRAHHASSWLLVDDEEALLFWGSRRVWKSFA